ncbi:MAG: TldD/PmbA family protein [Nitrospinota bacterium]
MKDRFQAVLHHLKSRGVEYADVRRVAVRSESVAVKNGRLQSLNQGEDAGYGVRVLHKGAWGFAAAPEGDAPGGPDGRGVEEALARVADRALAVAEAASRVNRERVRLAPSAPETGAYRGLCEEDPFAVPLEEKIDLLVRATEALAHPRTAAARGRMVFYRVEKAFASTEGAWTEQAFVDSGAGLTCTVAEGGDVQTRSFPTGHGGDFAQRGYEFIRGLGLVEAAPRLLEEARALLSAPPVPAGEWDVILESSQLCLQVHESCGHAIELDRVFGDEISLAGGSFLTTDKRGSFRYGSDRVHLYADATLPGALGSYGYDDEGVKARRVPVVEGGLFVGYMTSRESAARLGDESNGCMRADSWMHIPLIRMVNLNLEPGGRGAPTLEELIADTRRGLYIATNKSWSIDDQRLHFQFGCEAAWEIRNGRLGALYKDPVYAGITPEFWKACDAVCGASEWKMWGLPNCGKGVPMQTARVGHGAAPARFRGVRVRSG